MKDSCPLSLTIYGTKTNIQRLRNSTNLTRPTRPNMTINIWRHNDVGVESIYMILSGVVFSWVCRST